MKILLVEDEEMLNGITAKYLRAENMTVDTCFNGQQAIDYVNTSSYERYRYGHYDADPRWY